MDAFIEEFSYPIESEYEFEKAVCFLVNRFEKHQIKREKNVVAHSIRVAMYLKRLGCSSEVIAAGALHDLLENVPSAGEKLEKYFGTQVYDIVRANTVAKGAGDWYQRFCQSVKKCRKIGAPALLVKTMDCLDNLCRHRIASKHQSLARSYEKLNILLVELEACEQLHEIENAIDEVKKVLSAYEV